MVTRGILHGTLHGYKVQLCRCDQCRSAAAQAAARYRANYRRKHGLDATDWSVLDVEPLQALIWRQVAILGSIRAVATRITASSGNTQATEERALLRILHDQQTVTTSVADRICLALGEDLAVLYPVEVSA